MHSVRFLFNRPKPVIGMLHIPPLPGSPRNALPFSAIIDWVLKDADVLAQSGLDGYILENFGDTPFYPARVPAYTIAFMTALACEVRRVIDLPLGINALRNDAESALAIACASSASFIRINIHTGARLTDQGIIEGRAHETLRQRKLLGSDVQLFADVDVKHSAPLAFRDLKEEVEETLFRGQADAVIVTGRATGVPAMIEDLEAAKKAAGKAPVFAGSGVDSSNVASVLIIADGVIAGTSLKRDAITTNPVDPDRVREFMRAAR
jgi:uncharacterized protein